MQAPNQVGVCMTGMGHSSTPQAESPMRLGASGLLQRKVGVEGWLGYNGARALGECVLKWLVCKHVTNRTDVNARQSAKHKCAKHRWEEDESR